MHFKTLAEAQSDYAKTRKRNTIVFNESGFYIVGNEHSVFIPFFGITEISNIKNMDNSFAIDFNCESSYAKYYYLRIRIGESYIDIESKSIICPTNIYSPVKFKNICNFSSFFKWIFQIKYAVNPDFENFSEVFKDTLKEEYCYISEIRNDIIEKYNDFMSNLKCKYSS